MWRTLPVCALLLVLSLACRADAQPPPTETVIRMTVQARSAPKPALKYQLLPELREMNPGNPIQGYLKCFMEQGNLFYNQQNVQQREKWLDMPLRKLPAKELRDYGGGAVRWADYAARLDTPDWQILLKLKSDGLNLLLPDVQVLRNLASVLKVRFRGAVAERRFEDALVTAKTMLALSRHLGEHPTVIGDLVGIAIASITLGPLEEMIQQPGCPNLFWALTDLPSPFIDLRKGLQGERVWLLTELAGIDDHEPLSDAQIRKIVDRLQKTFNGPGMPPTSVRDWLETRAENKDHVRAARKRLVEALAPQDPSKLESFPPLQIVLLNEKLTCELRRDEETKALGLPYWQAQRVLAAIPPWKKEEESPLTGLIPTSIKVKQAQARLDQRIGLLRCVEALRLYAAEHDNKLPAKLEDVKLPLPVDAITGKPFVYKLDGTTAILRGTPPRGLEKVAAYNVRYEVSIAK